KLLGQLASICHELKGHLNADAIAALNQVAENSPVGIRSLYKDGVSMRLRTVLWAASNDDISTKSADRGGLDRRLVIFKFNRPVDERDPALKGALEKELSSIYNWANLLTFDEAVQIIKEYRNSSENVETQTEMLVERSSVYQWMTDADNTESEECCPVGVPVRGKVLHKIYTKWCIAANMLPLKRRSFWREIARAGAIRDEQTAFTNFTIPEKDQINIKALMGL
ncbi:MAG: hypothetical protein ACRC62_33870, partial [Microcoleus sp.]